MPPQMSTMRTHLYSILLTSETMLTNKADRHRGRIEFEEAMIVEMYYQMSLNYRANISGVCIVYINLLCVLYRNWNYFLTSWWWKGNMLVRVGAVLVLLIGSLWHCFSLVVMLLHLVPGWVSQACLKLEKFPLVNWLLRTFHIWNSRLLS